MVNCYTENKDGFQVGDWSSVWFIFAGYALLIGVLFFFLFSGKKENAVPERQKQPEVIE